MTLPTETAVVFLKALPTLLRIVPYTGRLHDLAGQLLLTNGQPDMALEHAEVIITNFPESPIGYTLKGQALARLRVFDQAIAALQLAIQRLPQGNNLDAVYKLLGQVFSEQGRYRLAYAALKRAIDPFSPDTSPVAVYQLASTARLAGKPRDAQRLLSFLLEHKLPQEDTSLRQQVTQALAELAP